MGLYCISCQSVFLRRFQSGVCVCVCVCVCVFLLNQKAALSSATLSTLLLGGLGVPLWHENTLSTPTISLLMSIYLCISLTLSATPLSTLSLSHTHTHTHTHTLTHTRTLAEV